MLPTRFLRLLLLGLSAFAGLTVSVMAGETLRFDEGVLRWLSGRATPTLDRVALEVTALGDGVVVGTIALVAGTLLWLLGQRVHAALLAAAVGGAWVIYPVLKLAFDRPRPRLVEWPAHYATSSSYPSGHATMAMALMAVLAYIIHRLSGRRRVGVAAVLLASAAVLGIGLSRLYLGVHYPSDVLAGYAVGFSWAVICARAVESLRFQRPAQERTGAVRRTRQDPAGESP